MSETPQKRPEDMTAWERWEMASFDPPKPPPPEQPKPEAAAEPAVTAPAVAVPLSEPEPAVKLPTAEEVETIYQQARDEGYRVGFDEGKQTMLAEAQKLTALFGKFDETLRNIETQIADELLALSLEVARQVVRETVRLQPEAILSVVREALQQLPHQHAVLYLNPADAALVREQLGDVLSHAGHRINEDINLQRGDCLLDTGNTRVDATLASRWQRVVATLGGSLALTGELTDNPAGDDPDAAP